MLTGKDLNKEIKTLELTVEKGSDEKGLLKALVKVGTLGLKMMQSMRTNQILMMKKAGIELVKPRVRKEETKGETEK